MARRRAQSPPHGEPSATRSCTHASASTIDSDAAKTESHCKQMLAVPPLLRKPKKEEGELQRFQARVVENQKALKSLVQARVARLKEADMQRRNDITAALLSALQTPNRRVTGSVARFPGTCIAENVVFAAAAAVLSAGDGLVREYERVNEGIVRVARETEGRDAVADEWRKEIKDFERILRAGARKAERDVGRVLGGVRIEEDGADGDEDGNQDVEMDGVEVMQGAEVKDELRNSLLYMERGVRRMVKALPMDE